MVSWWVGGALGLVALVTVVWPAWTHVFTAGRYRGPGKRSVGHRTWPIRTWGAVVLAAVAAWAVGEFWPGGTGARDVARTLAVAVLFIGLTIWFLAAMVSRHDRESRDVAATEAETGIRGVWGGTTPGYGFEIVTVGVTTVVAIAAGGILIGMRDQIGQPDADPTPTATVDLVDETLKTFNDLHQQYPLLSAVPDGDALVDPWWYAPVDADAELPHVVWHQSEPTLGGEASDYLDDADLVLAMPQFSCRATGIVVVETDTAVAVGIAVVAPPDPTASPDPGDPVPTPTPTGGSSFPCTSLLIGRDWFPVNLAAPLGDRTVETLGGRGILSYRPPVTYTP